jgi:hypothetical protein
MELDLPTPVSHPPCACAAAQYDHPKIHLQVLKISKIQLNHFLFKNNLRKMFTNSLLATAHLSNAKFDISTSPMNSVSTFLAGRKRSERGAKFDSNKYINYTTN